MAALEPSNIPAHSPMGLLKSLPRPKTSFLSSLPLSKRLRYEALLRESARLHQNAVDAFQTAVECSSAAERFTVRLPRDLRQFLANAGGDACQQ